MDVRQLFAITWRCASVICTWSNFSASANVAAETSGPTGGAVLKAGGAPGVGVADVVAPEPGFCSSTRQAATAPSSATGAWMRKWRREFIPELGESIVCWR
jgi:hypothetical protein